MELKEVGLGTRYGAAIRLCALAVLFAVSLGLLAGLAGRVPLAPLLALSAGAALLASVVAAASDLRRITGMSRGLLARGAGAGVLALFVAPWLVLSHRYTDAPPGTELIFFSGVLWGAMAIVAGAVSLWRSGRRTGAFVALAGGLAAVTGAAGILGNWERPSSFSPLVRFPAEEAWMLAAGVAFVAGVMLMAAVVRPSDRRVLAVPASTAALLCSLVLLLASPGGLGSLASLSPKAGQVALWAAAWCGVWLLMPSCAASSGSAATGAALVTAPAILSALVFAERLVGVSGPDPLVGAGLAGGLLLTVAGVERVLRAERLPARDSGPAVSARHAGLTRWARWAALALMAIAAAGLFMPAMLASVSAHRQASGLELSFLLGGWETVAGWAALACGALLWAAVADPAPWGALASLLAPPAYLLLLDTPYHVLSRWLSFDVQQDFGTEYASIAFRAQTVWPARIAVAGAAAGLVVVLTGRLMAARGERARSGPADREESA